MKRVVLVLAVISMLVAFNGFAFATPEQDMETIRTAADLSLGAVPDNGYLISADDVLKRIQSGAKNFLIVDVREKEEKYKKGHVPGAIYINFKEIAKPANLAKLPKDKDIILYCNTGHEQNKVMQALRMLGYKAYGLKFGYVAWKKEKPTEAMLSVIDNADKKSYPIE